MAKIDFGDLITQMRGSSGGSTYSQNMYGPYRKNRVSGLNPDTAAQSVVRARFAAITQAWRELTDAQRAEWYAHTSAFPFYDSLGRQRFYTAPALFVKLNISVQAADPAQAIFETPPQPTEVIAPRLETLTAWISEEALVAFDAVISAALTTHNRLIIYATQGLSAGITRPRLTLFRQIYVATDSDSTTISLTDSYTAIWGTPLIGEKVFIRAETVQMSSGQRIQSGIISSIVIAEP